MNYKKLTGTVLVALILFSCGKPATVETNATYYKKQEVTNEILEVSIEASGIIEAISSIEIKSYILELKLVILLKKALYWVK
jgi:HlyD family secretion protein